MSKKTKPTCPNCGGECQMCKKLSGKKIESPVLMLIDGDYLTFQALVQNLVNGIAMIALADIKIKLGENLKFSDRIAEEIKITATKELVSFFGLDPAKPENIDKVEMLALRWHVSSDDVERCEGRYKFIKLQLQQ